MAIPLNVARVRLSVCANSCTERCERFIAGNVDHSDAWENCPRRGWILAWGCYGPCNGPEPTVGIVGQRTRKNTVTSTDEAFREPTLAELATNFGGALARWSAAGFPVVTPEEYGARSAICDACDHWDGAARFGAGKCNAPGCGCTRFKRWLSTEQCKLGKWPTFPTIKP
jgi:hypothetical protein